MILLFGYHAHTHFHSLKGTFVADKTARYRYGLAYVACNGDRDKVVATDTTVRWVKGDPASARHVDLRPSMGGPASSGAYCVLIRIVEVSRDNARSETKATHSIDKECSEIAAGPSASS